jgi:Protein of unknown function (DUF3142)
LARHPKIAAQIAGAFACTVLWTVIAAPFRPQPFDARAGHGSRGGTSDHLPSVIFWAWERPEDLRFLRPQQAGVAFLAKTILLPSPAGGTGGTNSIADFVVRPRLQPLRVATGTPLIAVVRIEAPPVGRSPAAEPVMSFEAREKIASEIAVLQAIPSVRAVQIDFDATAGQRAFYATLLQDVRGKLPTGVSLSITALASWCLGDPWLAQLPPGTIDEAVPMLFRMGVDTSNVARFLRSGEKFPVAACRNVLGISTDEPLSRDLLARRLFAIPKSGREKRVYVFAPRPWTASTANAILQEWKP